MVTSAPGRRLAHACVVVALMGASASLGGAAWADSTPAPAAPAVDAVDVPAADSAPEPQPTIGSWIIGGTLLEGQAAPATKPVAKPATKPVAQPVAPARTVTRSSTRTHVSTATTRTRSTAPTATAPDGATALPFTGGHVEALLPTGIALLIGGLVLTLASRPRRALA